MALWFPQSSVAEQLPIKNYTTADGLVHGRVSKIVRDSHGFLWFCTYDGLSRFDGNNFVNYGPGDGLIHGRVNDLAESRDGTYWVATNQGLSSFSPARDSRHSVAPASANSNHSLFTNYTLGENQGANSVTSVLEDRAGRLWIGTQGGLYLMNPNDPTRRFQPVPIGHPAKPDHLFEISCLLEDDDGSLWIGSYFGLARRLPDGRCVHYAVFPGEGLDSIRALHKDDKGRLWIGHQAGLMIYKPDAAQSSGGLIALNQSAKQQNLPDRRLMLPAALGEARWYTAADGLLEPRVRAVCQRSDGHIWLGTVAGGLFEFDGERFRNYSTKQGLSRLITTLTEDRAGNLWVGSQVGGAARISRRGFATFRETDGLGMADVFSIFEDRAEQLIVVNNGWSLNRFDGNQFIAVAPNLPATVKGAATGNRPMMQAHDGEWWIATGEGLFRFPAVARLEDLATVAPKAVYREKDGMASSNISRLFEDSRGDVWISSYTPPVTLTRWERATGRLQRYGVNDGIPPNNWAHVFAEDGAGNVWMGLHYGELMRYRQGRFEVFGQSANESAAPPVGMMLALYRDRSGRMWVATEGGGAARVDQPAAAQPRFVHYTMKDGLSSNTPHSFTEDRWGRIYIGTTRGVDRLDVESGQVKQFTAGEGLSRGEVIAAFADSHGALWFGTREGLSRLMPEKQDSKTEAPPVFISALSIGNQRQPVPELGQRRISGLTLNPDQSQIQIEFFGLSFTASAPLRYRYKIEELNQDWSAPSQQRTVSASLSPGSYRFLVQAVSLDGTVSEEAAMLEFRVLPPFYQRWWFVALVTAAAATAAYYVYRLRVKRLLEIERVRTRIATDLHDDIGASLSRMAILSEVVKQQNGHNGQSSSQSLQMLTDIADSARGLVDSMSDIVWAIDPRRDDLGQVITRARQFAADVLDTQGIAWQFVAPPEVEKIKLDPEQRRHLFLLLKESLNNIARHAECRNVFITLSAGGNRLIAEIRDDGRGFTPPQSGATVAVLPKSRGGNGLGNMQARALEIGGQLTIESSPGQGTRLTLTVPLKR
ncbi:MAG TPA: two-component regulator propeller domain-containing protein [Blastocatellia bacterium]|nr:two-component regulator propeller domain-containing protein [Blastocatellia bacterium]HMZ21519.1 two-component regulator propeller domain-containing protein [Blastocatellia bacterium]HNG32163.1 two-component regulator propeller domain-containing protein [Blastocatellia bacterium]